MLGPKPPRELGPLTEFTDRDLHWVVNSCWTGPEASVDGLDWALVDQANADCALRDGARWQLGHAARSSTAWSFEFGERIVFNGLILVSQQHVTADGTRTETYEVAGDAALQRHCLQTAWGRGVDPASCASAALRTD